MKKYFKVLILSITFILINCTMAFATINSYHLQKSITKNHIIIMSFGDIIDNTAKNLERINLTDETTSTILKVETKIEGNKIYVYPPDGMYIIGDKYTLRLHGDIQTLPRGTLLDKDILLDLTIIRNTDFAGIFKNPDYTDPNVFLENDDQTRLTSDIIDFSSSIDDNKDFSTIQQIYKKINKLPMTKNGETKFINTSDNILKGKITGCTDIALLFSTIAREKGIPTIIVDAANTSWISDFQKDIPSMMSSHFFVECYIKDNWYLIDSSSGKIYLNYDKNNPSLPDGYYVFTKSTDVIDTNISSDNDYIQMVKTNFKTFNLSSYTNPNLEFIDLSKQLYFIN